MDPISLALVGACSALVGFTVYRWRNDDARRTRRVLRRAKVVPIAELVDGQLACIVGRVEHDDALIDSMMRQVPCVAFETITRAVDNDGTVVTTKITRHSVSFFVVDASGRARIDAPQAALCNKPFDRAHNWVERVVEEGDTVRLVGSVVLDPTVVDGQEHGFRDGAWKATLTGTAKFPLLVDVVDRA